MTIQEVLTQAVQQLRTISDTALLDAQLLLAQVLTKDRAYLYTWPEQKLTSVQWNQFAHYVNRRQQGEPIAYIINKKEFWSLELTITADTLTPRPETELLVDVILQQGTAPMRVLDLGTGSGAIALALAKEQPNWRIEACDRCPKALGVAQRNAQQLGLSTIRFVHSNWFDAFAEQRYDIIVSNPPYIAESDPCWQDKTLHYEPQTALLAADQGYRDLAIIIQQAPHHLYPNGQLLVEHGATQQDMVKQLLRAQGFTELQGLRDYAGLPRAVLARFS